VNVGSDGTLMATYSNGITRPEAQIALAKFTNTQGLQPDGNNNWVASSDSGPAIYGAAGSGSFGTIQGSALEESNVDLTAQLVGMMTAQRAYQANAQTIKTQDQIFSTLVNLR
jgi:flagellar hook protein FlgE